MTYNVFGGTLSLTQSINQSSFGDHLLNLAVCIAILVLTPLLLFLP